MGQYKMEQMDLKPILPYFVRQVLGKNQKEVCPDFNSNCINGAFNFFDPKPIFKPYTPLDMLLRLQRQFDQLEGPEDFCFGDLVVVWYRSQPSTSSSSIKVSELNQKDPAFPFGLVFDHIMVRLTPELVFHKPNPLPESCYGIEPLKEACAPSQGRPGLEFTFHRKMLS